MSGEPKNEDRGPLKRVPVILRSWDGPNSRIGLEIDLDQMPWGPFDALGQRLNLLVPGAAGYGSAGAAPESEVARALRHVEHAAARCGEFAQLPTGDQEHWLRSQRTWEWIREYLTALWLETEIEGGPGDPANPSPPMNGPDEALPDLPSMPGAASTLKAAAQALRSTPLSVWREAVGSVDPEAPTREEAVQTLLGVARVLRGQPAGGTVPSPEAQTGRIADPSEKPSPPEPAPSVSEDPDPDQVSFDYASGYDEGYRMGRRVGIALGSRNAKAAKERRS